MLRDGGGVSQIMEEKKKKLQACSHPLFIHLHLAAGSLQNPAKLVPIWHILPSQGTSFHFQIN